MSYTITNCPEGWEIKKMPQVVKWGSGGTPKTTIREYYEGGDIPWLIIGDLNDGIVTKSETQITKAGLDNSSAKMIPQGTLLVAMYGSIGKLGITGMECCTNQAIAYAKELHGVTTKYMYYYMAMMKSELIRLGKGDTQKNISQTVLNSLNVIVPPLPVQDAIVKKLDEVLSELDEPIETLRKTKSQLMIYRNAVLNEAFLGNFTKDKHIPTTSFCEEASRDVIEKLPIIPDEWRYIALANLGDLGRGKSKHRPRNDKKLFEDGKYPFLQTSEVKAATKYITNYSKMYGEFGLQQSKLWKAGTLCITIAANIAETAFLGIDACFPDSVVGYTPNEKINPWYIKYFIESQKVRLWMFAPATAQKNINLETLENLIVPYCDIEEQNVIVEEIENRMSVCESIEKTIDDTIMQADALRRSLLKKAFEGRLL